MSSHTKPERFHSYKPLTPSDVERIHNASLEVLSDTGFEVHNDRAFELFKAVASNVDSEKRVVRLKPETVMELVSKAPHTVTLHGRTPENDCVLGSGNVYYGTGGTALNILDYPEQTRREANLDDLVDVIRITDKLPNVHVMLLPTYPNELPVERVDVNRFFAGLLYTSKHIMGGVYTSDGIREVLDLATKVAGGEKELRERPIISIITCGISPLRLDGKYGDYMIQVAEAGIPAVVPVEPLCGATSPISIAGTLVIQNSDSLINVMLTQLVNPGTPVVYGCVSTSTDLRDVGYLGGPVESGLINAATAQMTHYYGLPYYATAGISDSKVLDAQVGYESAVNNLLVGMAGADFIHDAAGLMEFAMTVSKEKLVIDNEILGMALRAIEGIKLDEGRLALDVIREVGPGGNFLTARHTRKYMRKEHYVPQLSDRDKRGVWEKNGKMDTPQRAHQRVREILGAEAEWFIDRDQVEEITAAHPDIDRGCLNCDRSEV